MGLYFLSNDGLECGREGWKGSIGIWTRRKRRNIGWFDGRFRSH